MQESIRGTAGGHLRLLVRLLGGRLAASIAMMALAGMVEAVAVLLLILLVAALGIDVSTGGAADLAGTGRRALALTGLAPALLPTLVVYVIVIVCQAGVLRAQTILNLDIEYRFVALLRSRLYDAIVNARWLFLARTRGTDVSHALTTEVDRAGMATYQLLWAASTVFVMVAQVALALRISTPVTLLVFAAGGLLASLLAPRFRRARQAGEAITIATSEVHALAVEHLAGMKTVKSQAAERASAAEFTRLADTVAGRALDAVRLQADVRALFEGGAVVILAVLLVASVRVFSVPPASLFVLLFLFARLMPRVSSVQQGLHQYATALPALAHIEALQARAEAEREDGGAETPMKDPFVVSLPNHEHRESGHLLRPSTLREPQGRPEPSRGATSSGRTETPGLRSSVRLEQVSFAYEAGARLAVGDVTLSIPAGQTTALVGPSGCGKTTVADLVTGLLAPTSGRVVIDDLELTTERARAWRSRLGYVSQDTFFFHDTVRANLRWAAPEATNLELHAALGAAAADFVFQLPEGLDTIIGDRGTRLSGGERQRLALARALARRPALLILDEATSALDAVNERKVFDAIERLHGSVTMLLITHRLWTLGGVDSIHVLEDGRLVESGPWDTLRAAAGSRFATLCRAGAGDAIAGSRPPGSA
jgi:ATP-binding cassette subfamily C protein